MHTTCYVLDCHKFLESNPYDACVLPTSKLVLLFSSWDTQDPALPIAALGDHVDRHSLESGDCEHPVMPMDQRCLNERRQEVLADLARCGPPGVVDICHDQAGGSSRALHLVVETVAQAERTDDQTVLTDDVVPLDYEAFVEEALGKDDHCMFIQ